MTPQDYKQGYTEGFRNEPLPANPSPSWIEGWKRGRNAIGEIEQRERMEEDNQ